MFREMFFVGDPRPNIQYREVEISKYKFLDYIRDPKDLPQTEPKGAGYHLFLHNLYHLVLCYSLGTELPQLKKLYLNKVLSALKEYKNSSQYSPFDLQEREEYNALLWVLSLGVIFDLSPEERMDLASVTESKNEDQLIGWFKENLFSSAQSASTLAWENPYQQLWNAIHTNGTAQQAHIDSFLKTYYASLHPMPWYNSHVKHQKDFFGYWSLELSAIVKVLKISDAAFTGNMFYPAELVKAKLPS